MKQIILYSFALCFLAGCASLRTPFSQQTPPPAPDYSLEANWAALPTTHDHADLVPDPAFQNRQSSAEIDVFFIHPTILLKGKKWTADVRDSAINYKVDVKTMENQASVFNGTCRVYAPRYRQMHLSGFYVKDTVSKHQALQLAYQDVKAAFEYYLKNYNHGRPFILAGHSQGTVHATYLLNEYISGKELQNQLVAAYLVGFTIQKHMAGKVPICESPEQSGCVVNWNSFREGTMPKHPEWYTNAIAVNPVSWKTDENPTDSSLHKGVLWYDYKLHREKKLTTRLHNGILWVENPFKLPLRNNFHVGDYNLFWVNIRENVALRSQNYLQQNH